jgi:hypothetical protein
MTNPTSVAAYLQGLPTERRKALETLRAIILGHLPAGYEEGIEFGMPSYFVPLARFSDTYNKRPLMLAAFASQKGYMSLYLMAVYGDPKTRAWFEKAYRDAGKKLDMGKSCVRFKSLDDLPLDVVGEAIERVSVDGYLESYRASRSGAAEPAKTKPAAVKKAAPKKKTAPKKKAAAAKKAAAR